MGSLVSSHRFPSSFRVYQPAKQERRRGSKPNPKQKRDSMSRPVLRLQVKTDTMDRNRRSASALPIVQSTSMRNLRSTKVESGVYDHLSPRMKRSSSVPHSQFVLTNHAHQYSDSSDGRSRDSMVIVQFVDNGNYNITSTETDEHDYDRLLPRGEFEHLCTCTYGRYNSSDNESNSEENHLTNIHIGPHPVIQNFDIAELRERIYQHVPPPGRESPYGACKRSKSIDAIASYRVTEESHSTPRRRKAQSTGYLEEDLHWSLGESVLKKLSESGIPMFDVENPTHESELEINRTWPHLREKLRKWRQSQQSLDYIDEGVFADSPEESDLPRYSIC